MLRCLHLLVLSISRPIKALIRFGNNGITVIVMTAMTVVGAVMIMAEVNDKREIRCDQHQQQVMFMCVAGAANYRGGPEQDDQPLCSCFCCCFCCC